MSVIYLKDRVTSDEKQYSLFLDSDHSSIFVSGEPTLDKAGTTIDLHVGSRWYDCKRQTTYEIPNQSGLKLNAGEATVIEVAETIGVPYNAFGLVSGKGRLIFQGVFISLGKIDPGFKDQLLIGLYNGGREQLVLKTGDSLCGCSFFTTETHSPNLGEKRTVEPKAREKKPSRIQLAGDYLRRDWKRYVPWIIGVASFLATAGNFCIQYLKYVHGK